MTNNAKSLYDMIYLLSCSVNCVRAELSRIHTMDLEAIHKMSRSHSISSIVYIALEDAGLSNEHKEILSSWEQDQLYTLFREERFNIERDNLLSFCESNSIWYMPLKGIYMKEYYPYPGMRQMGDNDILFDENNREKIHQWFVENEYKIENYKKGNHDVYDKDGITFEMHTELFGVQCEPIWRDYYKNVKERLILNIGTSYGFHFTDEDLYIYLIVHECKHYRNGGIGLRFMLDDYVFLKAKEKSLDWSYIQGELRLLGADAFEQKARELCQILFGGNFDPQALTTEENDFLIEIAQSGTFGTVEGHIKKKIESQGGNEFYGKLKYVWKRLFPDIEFMREYYPLCRHLWFVPFVYLYRIILKLLTKKDKLKNEIETLRNI